MLHDCMMRDSKQQIKVHIHPRKQQREQHAFLPSVIFLDQTTKIFSESPSITMVLWFKLCDFLGPIVCFLLVDNDIMTEWIHADRKYLEQKDSEVISAHVWMQSTSRVMTKHKNTLWVLDNKQHCVKMSCSSLSRCSEGSKPTAAVQSDISATQHAWMKFNYTHTTFTYCKSADQAWGCFFLKGVYPPQNQLAVV